MKVSIITPSFNQGHFIERTLRSVAEQASSGIAIQHLVFDGGSTDSTVDVLKRFEPAVRWVSRSDNGQTDAVNQGLHGADGDIIGWLNSDDVYYPGAVARVVAFFEAHADVDIVYGMGDHIDVADVAFEEYPSEAWNFERLKETCFICQPTLFLRRRVIEQHGVLDESLEFCMDYEYWLRLGKAGARFVFLPHKLAGSRLYAENKTLGSRVKVHREINDMFKSLFGKVPDSWLFAYAHAIVESRTTREANPNLFVLKIGISALAAAIKWNHGVSGTMINTTCTWLRGTTAEEKA